MDPRPAVIESVRVERRGDGVLLVTWEPPGFDVVVSVGPSPDKLAPAHYFFGTASAEIEVRPGTHYVGVAPAGGGAVVIGADRRLPLEGATNFRDLGGYRSADGRTVRWGRVFRSDALHLLTDDDVGSLRGLGLATVFDLRRDVERERSPSVAHGGGVRTEVLAIGGAASQHPELVDQILAGKLTAVDDAYMIDEYLKMAVDHAADFGRLLSALAEPGALPALFHCTAGKDRTGMAAALLLLVLGVELETVLDDYELSSEYRGHKRMADLAPALADVGVDIEAVRALLSARRPVLEATLAHVLREFATVERYLVGPAGMDPTTVEELRELLLV